MTIRKELWFGFILMALIIAGTAVMLLMAPKVTNGHLGLMMLALVVVAIMLGFPTAFTLMGMGILFAFFAYHSGDQSAAGALKQTLDLMVQRAFSVMSNDVLISIPLFVFMGYLVERANLIEKLFKSLHLATSRIPGSLAVATIVTCAVFATATGIVGAVVTLMGLLVAAASLNVACNKMERPAYALTSTGRILGFDTARPTKIKTEVRVTGLGTDESLVQLEYRPANDLFYGLSNQRRLYTVDPKTGATTRVSATAFTSETLVGPVIDFNPVVDRLRGSSRQNADARRQHQAAAADAGDASARLAGALL